MLGLFIPLLPLTFPTEPSRAVIILKCTAMLSRRTFYGPKHQSMHIVSREQHALRMCILVLVFCGNLGARSLVNMLVYL